MSAVSHLRFPAVIVSGCLLILTGCGQGEYDSRMSGAGAAISRRAASGPQELATAHSAVRNAAGSQGLKVRFPTLFTGAQTTSLDASKPNAKLLQADLPGFCYTMERPLADDAGKTIPAYCYLYAVPKGEADNLHNAIQQAAGGAAWADSAAVGTIAVKLLKSSGDMDFTVNGNNEKLPAQLEVYSFDAGNNRVVIGWKAANSAATKNKLFEAVKSSMSSAQLDTPAAAPAAPMAPAAGS